MSSYINPLHPPIPSGCYSPFSVLANAQHGNHAPRYLSPTQRRVPQPAFAPSSKWRSSMSIPRKIDRPITFDFLGFSQQGVPMRELSSRGASALGAMIQGAHDPVLANTGLRRIVLVILVCLLTRRGRDAIFLTRFFP